MKNNAQPQMEFPIVTRVWYPTVHTRQPDGSVVSRPGPPVTLSDDMIGTPEAASILGLAARTVAEMCDDGRFIEGVDWFRPGEKVSEKDGKTRGKILLRREAVMKKMMPQSELFGK
jgi:hypothetical protein